MAQTSASISIDVSAKKVWQVAGDFAGMHLWHPAILKTTKIEGSGVGAVRHLEVDGVGTVIETLEEHDDATMRFVYSAIQMPLPIRDYRGELIVRSSGENRCNVEYSGSFEADGAPEEDMIAGLHGFYQAGLESLAAKVV